MEFVSLRWMMKRARALLSTRPARRSQRPVTNAIRPAVTGPVTPAATRPVTPVASPPTRGAKSVFPPPLVMTVIQV